jgi:hypothetical protein
VRKLCYGDSNSELTPELETVHIVELNDLHFGAHEPVEQQIALRPWSLDAMNQNQMRFDAKLGAGRSDLAAPIDCV